ncbi:hypothetical protein [Nocardioides litoris]|uniref:hypothetical protein n=1 Tax=Nocardioides litoris TaxID=1926648 RepID=UPI0014773AE4|nr:hypothetical protein [Nocardioides litoris]
MGAAVVVAGLAFGLVVALGVGEDDRGRSLTPETVEAGQCVDVAEQGGRLDLTEADCDRPHDAEVVLTTVYADAYAETTDLADAEKVCTGLLEPADLDRLEAYEGDLSWALLIDEPSNVDSTDRLVCYVEDPEAPLTASLL